MSREDYIKLLIKEKGYNVKEFAALVEIPYTSMLSMLKNLGGTAIDSVIKICKALEITVEDLEEASISEILNYPLSVSVSEEEHRLLKAYSSANLKDKNTARMALDLLPLESNNVEFSKEFDIQEDMIKTLKELSAMPTAKLTKQK